MASRRLEIAAAAAGLIALGLLGHWLTRERASQISDQASAPEPAPIRGPTRARIPASNASPDAVEVTGLVRDLLTGEGVGEVMISFVAGSGVEFSAMSNASGRYSIKLAAGRYRVRALGDEVAAFERAALSLAGDIRQHNLDIGVVRLARIRGRVVDHAGEPLAGIPITHRTALLGRVLTSDDTAPAGQATSADDGVFALQVPPGEVALIAHPSDRPEATTTLRWVPPGSQLSGVEIVVDQGVSVAGTVVDPAGAPVAGAEVVGIADGQTRAIGTQTDGSGAFQFTTFASGQISLRAQAVGFAPSPSAVVDVEVGRDKTGLVLRLGAPRALSGRVVDDAGAPVAGARVQVEPMIASVGSRSSRSSSGAAVAEPGDDQPPVIGRAQAISDGNGAFALTGLDAGPFSVVATADGFAPTRLTGVAAPTDDLEITLSTHGAIAGTVTGSGAPIYDFTVSMIGRADPDRALRFVEIEPVRVASLDGSYRIDELRSGTYDVTLSAPGLAPQEVRGVVVPAGGAGEASADLATGAVVQGRVLNAKTGAPVPGATVRLTTGSESPIAYTDSKGEFKIFDIAAGRRSVEFLHPGYVGKIETGVELVAGHAESVDVALEPLEFGAESEVEFAGIGAVIRTERGRLLVQGFVPNGPAESAGLKEGDLITHIDGLPTGDRGFGQNIESLRGVVGTVVRLRLLRGEQSVIADVVRAKIRFKPSAPTDETDRDGD